MIRDVTSCLHLLQGLPQRRCVTVMTVMACVKNDDPESQFVC